MADDDQPEDSSKTEDPSQKKLDDARKRGQVAQSKEMNTWLMLLGATLVVAVATPTVFFELTVYLKKYLEQAHLMPSMPGGISIILTDLTLKTFGIIIVPLIFLMVAAFIGPFAQVGVLFAPEVIKPDLSKISIFKGFGRLFSMKSVIELVKGIFKLVVLTLVGIALVQPYMDRIDHTMDMPLGQLLEDMLSLTLRMLIGMMVVLLILAVIDLLYQRYEFNKQMRMTKQEVKDEYKQTEGDPFIKGKLKQLRAEKARQRMMQAVPRADVVITNPTHYSVALEYDPDKFDAPRVIAKGVDTVALRIREVAKENNIILFENPPLARSLYDQVEIDDMIPGDLFKAVAEVISYVYKKQGNKRKK